MYTYTGLVHKGPSESIFHSQHCLCTSALWSLLLQRSFLGRLIVLKIPLHQVCPLAGTATNCSAQHLMKIWAWWISFRVKLILFVTTRITSYPSWVFHQWQQKASGELRPWEFSSTQAPNVSRLPTMATTSHTITSESSIMAMTFHPVHIKLSPSGLRSSIRSRHKLDRPKKLKFQPSLNAVSHHSGVTVNDVQVNVFVKHYEQSQWNECYHWMRLTRGWKKLFGDRQNSSWSMFEVKNLKGTVTTAVPVNFLEQNSSSSGKYQWNCYCDRL